MGRPGRPRKDLTPTQRERNKLTDDVVSKLLLNGELSDEQVNLLKKTLDNTLKSYDLEKQEVPKEEMTCSDVNIEALNAFIRTKKAESKSERTTTTYQGEISKLFSIINKDYRQITADDIREYLEFRKEHDHCKPVTLQNIRMFLMSFFKWCVVEDRILKSPMDKIGTIRKERKIIQTLTDEEVEIIRCACKNERDLAIVDLLSSSGMRVSELCRLDIRDVDFENGEAKVYGKGAKERICFLTGRAKVHLKWYLESRVDDNPALFVTSKSPYTRLTKNGVEYILKEVGKATGIPPEKLHLHPHKFRATLATNMLNKGADIALVQGTLGHQSPDTTLQCYAKMSTDTLKQAHNKFIN